MSCALGLGSRFCSPACQGTNMGLSPLVSRKCCWVFALFLHFNLMLKHRCYYNSVEITYRDIKKVRQILWALKCIGKKASDKIMSQAAPQMLNITSDTRSKQDGAGNLTTFLPHNAFLLLSRTPCPVLASGIEVLSSRWRRSEGDQHESQRSWKVDPHGKV